MSWVIQQQHLLVNSAAAVLNQHLGKQQKRHWQITTQQHAVWINYLVSAEKLARLIPSQLQPKLVQRQGQLLAWLTVFASVQQVHLKALPRFKHTQAQMVYRTPVQMHQTAQAGVWQWGEQLDGVGVKSGLNPQAAQIRIQAAQTGQQHYTRLQYQVASHNEQGNIQLNGSHTLQTAPPGFRSLAQFHLLLIFPNHRFYQTIPNALEQQPCYYADYPNLQLAETRQLYFASLANCGLLSASDMQNPHSVVVCPSFTVHH